MSERTTATVIAASPGWYVALLMPGNPASLDEDPIIAWSIEGSEDRSDDDASYWYHRPKPILLCGEDLGLIANVWMIRDPLGRYHHPNGFNCASAEECHLSRAAVRGAKNGQKPCYG
jgi:hypothetical protein